MKSSSFVGMLLGLLLIANPAFAETPPDESGSPARQLAALPLRATGVFIGVAVAVPVGIAGKVVTESKRMVGTMRSDFGVDIVGTTLALSMGIPYGIASGTILGSIKGAGVGVKYGYAKPFSKESMGLAESEEE